MRLLAGRSRYQVVLGAALGLAVSAGVLALQDGDGPAPPRPPDGPLVSECDGAIRELVIHYTGESAETVLPTYRSLVHQLPADVTVHVVCPSRREFEELATRVGPTACLLSPAVVNHPMTAWSRDRWLPLGPSANGQMALLYSCAEDGAEVWPAREGDHRIAQDLARLCTAVAARASELYFDGGDFDADGETVFVRPIVLLRNLQRTVATRGELLDRLAAVLRRRVVLLDEAPDHHVGMYLMPIGARAVVVGDPRAAQRLLDQSTERTAAEAYLPGGPDFSDAPVAKFEAVAARCRTEGYQVVRIPLVPGSDGRTWLTYVNVLLDERDGRRIVYMPVYKCAPVLNRAAEAVWREQGFEVRHVDCDLPARQFGTLHCLVHVLRRG